MEHSQIPNEVISLLISISSILITLYIGKINLFTPLKTDVTKNQLYKVYLPLFKFIEPYLYKKPGDDVLYELLQIFNHIKEKHYELIPCNLIEYFHVLSIRIDNKTYSHEHFEALCAHIEYQFEKRRKYLSLPTRSFFYKLKYGQFNLEKRTLFDKAINIIGIGLFYLVILLVIITTINVIIMFLTQFMNFK